MKKIIYVLMLLCIPAGMQAQNKQQSMRDIFKAMPDSLCPYLTTNNRLDMIDFMDAKMKAAVDNQLRGESQMIYLSDDSLCLNMSSVLTCEMWRETADTAMVICVKYTYKISERQQDVVLHRFTSDWRLLSSSLLSSSLLRRDEQVN